MNSIDFFSNFFLLLLLLLMMQVLKLVPGRLFEANQELPPGLKPKGENYLLLVFVVIFARFYPHACRKCVFV